MDSVLSGLAAQHDWPPVILAGILCLLTGLVACGLLYRAHAARLRVVEALNHMRHGLLMFDAQGRLLLYNRRYLEMYGISQDLLDAGCSMRELLQRRVAAGTFDRDPDRFLAEFVERCKVETGTMTLPDGRTISIKNSSRRRWRLGLGPRGRDRATASRTRASSHQGVSRYRHRERAGDADRQGCLRPQLQAHQSQRGRNSSVSPART